MKEHPILFSSESVRAILRETNPKTQTRRVVKPQPTLARDGLWDWKVRGRWAGAVDPRTGSHSMRSPYGKVGSILWVRETWALVENDKGADCVQYRSNIPESDWKLYGPWRPSIFMPRAASRITLEVTDVRVERLASISVADCVAEGIHIIPGEERGRVKEIYARLWDTINGQRAPWRANPWVWVVSFQKVAV